MVERLRVGVFIYDSVNILEVAGSFDVLSEAAMPSHEPDRPPIKLFNVFTFSEKIDVLETSNGLLVTPDYDLESVPVIDVLILPGGPGAKRITQDSPIVRYIQDFYDEMELVGTVSTGARIFGLTGLANERRMTTSKEYLEEFSKEFPEIKVVSGFRYLDDDTVVSSSGPSSSIDLGLYIIYKLFGIEAVNYTSEKIDYVFTP